MEILYTHSNRVWSGQVRPSQMPWPLIPCRLGRMPKFWPNPGPIRVGLGRPSAQPGLALPLDSVDVCSILQKHLDNSRYIVF